MKKYHFIGLGLIGFFLLFLSACFLPEDFEATITVKKDGSYTFEYDGNLVFAMALPALKQGTFSKKDEESLKEQAKELAETPGFKKVKYNGKARYQVLVEESGNALAENYYFISKEVCIFSIKKQEDGNLNIKAFQLGEKDRDELKKMDFTIAGTLEINVEKGLQVIQHNASSVTDGTYFWKIKNPEEAPILIIQKP